MSKTKPRRANAGASAEKTRIPSRKVTMMTDLSRPNLKLFATIAVDDRRGTCPTCGNQNAYRADLEQFGRCVDCAEAILGTRPVLIREMFTPVHQGVYRYDLPKVVGHESN